MRSADEYRAQAAQAERAARQISRVDHREELLALARTWRELADRLEQDAPPPPDAAGEVAAV